MNIASATAFPRHTIALILLAVALRGQDQAPAPAVAAGGQDQASAPEHAHGFDLATPLSVSAGYDSHFIVGSQTLSDTVTIVTAPTFAWNTSTHLSSFSLNYQPEGEIFAHNSNLDAVNHSALLTFKHRLNSRWSLDFGDSFLSTMDPTRALANSLFLFPWGRFTQNTLYGDLTYRFTKQTNITFRADSVYTTANIPSLKGGLDNITGAGTIAVDHSFNSRHQVSGGYTFIYTSPLVSQPYRTASGVSLLMAGYTYTVRPSLVIRLTAGGTEGGRQSGFTGSAILEKRIGDVWVGGGYQRYLGFFGGVTPVGELVPGQIVFASGVTPTISYDTFSIRAAGQLTRRIGLQATGQRAVNATDTSGLNIRSLVGQFRLNFKINERLTLFVDAEHYGQNVTFFLNEPMSRNRYFGGLEIALSRPVNNSTRRRRDTPPQDSFVIRPVNRE